MAAFQEALERSYREACARHPGVALPFAEFEAWVAARAGRGAAHLDDLFVACAAARGDAAAVAVVEREHVQAAAAALARTGLGRADVDEVSQALRERLLVGAAGRAPRLADYAGTGPLGSWVRVVALRLAIDLRRARPNDVPADLLRDVAGAGGPELEHARHLYLPAIEAALRAALASLPPDERLLLSRHFVDGLDATTIARLTRVHPTTILRRLERLRVRLARKARQALRERLSLDAAAAESVLRMLRSEIELRLSTALGAANKR